MQRFILADGAYGGYQRDTKEWLGGRFGNPTGDKQVPVFGEADALLKMEYLPPMSYGVTARYIRIIKSVADTNGPQYYPCAITEIKVIGQGVNYARGQSVLPLGNAALTDGNFDDGPDITDVRIDLGIERWVEKVTLHRSADSAMHNHSTFRVLYSLDGSVWLPFGKDVMFKPYADRQTVNITPPRSFRYWRIDQASGVGSWNGAWAISEFEMYLAPVTTDAPPAFTPANVALHATILAAAPNGGSVYGTQEPAFDGVNAGGQWYNTAIMGGIGAPTPFLEFDIGSLQTVMSIQVITANYMSGMRLQACANLADGWETIMEVAYYTSIGVHNPYYNIQG